MKVVLMYYTNEMTLKEIGSILGVKERPRVANPQVGTSKDSKDCWEPASR